MKNKIVVSLIFIMIVLFSFQYVVKATNNNEDEWWFLYMDHRSFLQAIAHLLPCCAEHGRHLRLRPDG